MLWTTVGEWWSTQREKTHYWKLILHTDTLETNLCLCLSYGRRMMKHSPPDAHINPWSWNLFPHTHPHHWVLLHSPVEVRAHTQPSIRQYVQPNYTGQQHSICLPQYTFTVFDPLQCLCSDVASNSVLLFTQEMYGVQPYLTWLILFVSECWSDSEQQFMKLELTTDNLWVMSYCYSKSARICQPIEFSYSLMTLCFLLRYISKFSLEWSETIGSSQENQHQWYLKVIVSHNPKILS